MVETIVGKKKGMFPNDEGVAVDYAKLYCLCPPPEGDGNTYDGLVPDAYSLSVSQYDDIPVDFCKADIGTNSKGKIISIKLVD